MKWLLPEFRPASFGVFRETKKSSVFFTEDSLLLGTVNLPDTEEGVFDP